MTQGADILETDYLVVGAGAMGMAFTDALIDHADVDVVMVDRRHGVGGHWLDAYPFVRLHQASAFYGVASTLLGGGRIQQDGPEAGLHERATAPEICAYYGRVLPRAHARVRPSVLPSRTVTTSATARCVSRLSGPATRGPRAQARRRRPLPRTADPGADPSAVRRRDGVPVVAVNDLVTIDHAPSRVRDRRLGQDRDRRVHLAAGQRRGA